MNSTKKYRNWKTTTAIVLLFFCFLFVSKSSAQIPPNNSDGTISLFNIKPGSIIKGELNLKVEVPYVQGIEVLLTPINSNVPILTSQAKKLEGDYWNLALSSRSIPDGEYYLSAKLKNPFGEFESSKTKIRVNNSASNNDTVKQSDVDEWIKKVELEDKEKIQEDVNEFIDAMIDPEWMQQYFHIDSCLEKEVCGSQADPDQDELVNFEEFRLKTDPTKSDTDGDGYLDGNEVKNGYDPLKYSPGHKDDKIVFESPRENGQVQADIYKILDIISTENQQGKSGITLKGKALPNSFVNIFIYSSPVILTIKTDSNGSWSYLLDKDLKDGNHEAYVAVTDNAGKIMAKSEPIFFVKKAQAVNILPPGGTYNSQQVSSPAENRKVSYLIVAMIIAGITLVASLIIIGFRIAGKKQPDQIA